eukprot:scaffold208538_cov88-Attheya_sp.AAC.1
MNFEEVMQDHNSRNQRYSNMKAIVLHLFYILLFVSGFQSNGVHAEVVKIVLAPSALSDVFNQTVETDKMAIHITEPPFEEGSLKCVDEACSSNVTVDLAYSGNSTDDMNELEFSFEVPEGYFVEMSEKIDFDFVIISTCPNKVNQKFVVSNLTIVTDNETFTMLPGPQSNVEISCGAIKSLLTFTTPNSQKIRVKSMTWSVEYN